MALSALSGCSFFPVFLRLSRGSIAAPTARIAATRNFGCAATRRLCGARAVGEQRVRNATWWAAGAFPRQSSTGHPTRTTTRHMFIQTKDTPNPNSMMFVPGCPVLSEAGSATFDSIGATAVSPLARALFRISSVRSVMLGSDFITVVKDDAATWPVLKPSVFATIMDFFSSNQPVMLPKEQVADAPAPTKDSEVVAMIKELLDERIRPSVQGDGGDIIYKDFKDGIVYLKLVGSCTSCPSSTITLKNGVENMLMHYVDEVKGVQQIQDELDEVNKKQLDSVEEKLGEHKHGPGCSH